MNNEYNLSILEALFKDYLFAEKISKVSIKNYRSDIKHFTSWFYLYVRPYVPAEEEGHSNVSYIELFIQHSSRDLIEEYKGYLIDSQIPLKTINRRLSAIRRFYAFCVKRGYIKDNPAEEIQNVVPERKSPIYVQTVETKSELDDFKMFLSSNLNKEKHAQVMEDVKEFMDLWN